MKWGRGLCFAFLCAINLPLLGHYFFPVHDSLTGFLYFSAFYRHYFYTGEFLTWLPNSFFGVQTAIFDLCVVLTPTRYLCIFLGRFFQITDAYGLYCVSIFLEQFVLLCGVSLLCGKLFRLAAVRTIVAIAVAGTSFWAVQVAFNFHLLIYVPYLFYGILRFAESRRINWLLFAVGIGMMSLVGNPTYLLPLYLFLFLVFLLILLFRQKKPTPWYPHGFTLLSVLLITLIGLVGLQYLAVFKGAFTYVSQYSPAREVKDASVSWLTFLWYGFPDARQYLELFYALPFGDLNITFYTGLVTLLFLPLAFRHSRDRISQAFLGSTAALILFSCSYLTAAATLAYLLIPLMNYYRHLQFSLPLVRFLLILVSGFGIQKYLERMQIRDGLQVEVKRRYRRYLLTSLAGLLGLSLILDGIFFRNGQPYPVHYPLAGGEGWISPWAFHYVMLAMLTLVVLRLSLGWRRGTQFHARWITGLVVFELLSYQSLLAFTTPVATPSFSREWFEVKPYQYVPQRSLVRTPEQMGPGASWLISRWGHLEASFDSAFNVDTCDGFLRRHYINEGVDQLLRTRLGLPLGSSNQDLPDILRPKDWQARGNIAPIVPRNDPGLLKAFGCASPKLYVVPRIERLLNPQQMARHLQTASDLSRQVATLDDAGDAADLLNTAKGVFSTPRVREYSYSGITVDVEVSEADEAWLVYADGYHAEWVATVNNLPSAVIPANLAFKAVKLKRGPNQVRMNFEPSFAPFAVLLGAISAGLALAMLLWGIYFQLGWSFSLPQKLPLLRPLSGTR